MSFNENNKTLIDLTRAISGSVRRDLDGMLPCIVTRVSGDRQRVSVQPIIKRRLDNCEYVSRAEIHGITVASVGAGGLVMSWPISVGDKGWIEASDRDISLFLQSQSESDPNTGRNHSFSDGRFIPDVFTGFSVAAEDNGAVVIQSLDGSVKLSIDSSRVKIQNGTTSLVVNDGTVTGIAPSGFNFNGATITGDGRIIDSDGISVGSHYHTQKPDAEGVAQQDTSKPAGNV